MVNGTSTTAADVRMTRRPAVSGWSRNRLASSAPNRYRHAVGHPRRYRYVGPAELLNQPIMAGARGLDTPASLHAWLAQREPEELAEPFTFVVGLDRLLRLAARRSEHVTLAAGQDVLAAGEITFASAGADWYVAAVSNQSTGYCPDPDSWAAVAAALEHVDTRHPSAYTDPIIFRRCPACHERNIVRDEDFICVLCDSALPTQWNFAQG